MAGGWPAAFMLDKVADSLKGQVVDTRIKSEFVRLDSALIAMLYYRSWARTASASSCSLTPHTLVSEGLMH